MVRLDDALILLNTLILSTIDWKVSINKYILCDIHTYLHKAQENIDFLPLESQFQWDELQ